MKVFKLLSILSLVLFMSSCGQDPLANESESVRNGRPPEKSRPDYEETKTTIMQLDVKPRNIIFRENEEGSFNIQGRLLDLKVPYKVSASSLPDGAFFDEATGDVTWTPEKGFVPNDRVNKDITIKFVMETEAQPFLKVEKSFTVWVAKGELETPALSFNSSLSGGYVGKVNQGRSIDFEVAVIDPSATVSSAPTIQSMLKGNQSFAAQQSGVSVVTQLGTPKADPKDNSKFIYTMRINLAGAGLVSALGKRYTFALRAFSSAGVSSNIIDGSFEVKGTPLAPEIILPSSIRMAQGQQNSAAFSVFVPLVNREWNSNSILDVSDFEIQCKNFIDKSIDCKCKNESTSKLAKVTCTINWDPKKVQLGSHVIRFKAVNTDKIDRKLSVTKNFTVPMLVVGPSRPAAVSAPAVAPSAAPKSETNE